MSKLTHFGIGFLSGRPNVCNIINRYYKDILEQGEKFGKDIEFTIFILYDLEYQHISRQYFYNIIPEVYKKIKIEYITPEDIEEEKKVLISRYGMNKKDIDLVLGHGYARARNSILYFALKKKIDYLMFWDDDEYPIASVIDENNEIKWYPQENILEHLKHIEKADITLGYRCGNMSPVPYIEYNEELTEEDFKNYIDGISNEAVCWNKVNEIQKDANGIKYADKEILKMKKVKKLRELLTKDCLYASGICFNLKRIKNIPSFYNPPLARGEDTFLATLLKDCNVVQIPTYHFHDGFLKYTNILKGKYPKKLNKIALEDNSVEERFLKASIGWIKYKPLLIYITDRKNYRQIIDNAKENLEKSISKMNTYFKNCDFSILLSELYKYDKDVRKHYNEYIKTNEVWNELKMKLK